MKNERGRPRDEAIDTALEEALESLSIDGGLVGVTVNKLAAAAGTSKPAFYRRYESLAHFLTELLVRRLSTDPTVDTGALRSDLEHIQRDQIAMFGEPFIVQSLPVILVTMRESNETARAFSEKFLRPRRDAVIAVLDRAVARGEIPAVTDPEWVVDMLSGPFLMRAILPGIGPLDELLVQQSTEAVLRELRARRRPVA